MKLDSKEFLKIAKKATHISGKYLVDNFGIKHVASYKSENDIGLDVDKESESIIIEILKGKYPDHNYYSEELGVIDNKSKFTWFIDPLDGTNNYFAGIPYFSISIALLFDNEIVVGVVYNPISKQFFEAVKDGGAFLNGNKIEHSNLSELNKCVCSYIQGHQVSTSSLLSVESTGIKNILENNFRRVISTWAPALDWALLASGGIEALISFESELEDLYAGLLIAKESGINITNFEGEESLIDNKRIIATNKNLKNELLNLLKKESV